MKKSILGSTALPYLVTAAMNVRCAIFLALAICGWLAYVDGLSCLACSNCPAMRRKDHKKVECNTTYCLNSTTVSGVKTRECGRPYENYKDGCHNYTSDHSIRPVLKCRCDSDDCNGPEVDNESGSITIGIIIGTIVLLVLCAIVVVFICLYWSRCPYYKHRPRKAKAAKPRAGKKVSHNPTPSDDQDSQPGPSNVAPPPPPQKDPDALKPAPQTKSPQVYHAIDDKNSFGSVFKVFR